MNIVLVHGIFDSGAIFKRLVCALEEQGHKCWVPTLKPSDGRRGIHDLALKLKVYIDENIGPNVELALVGFSMGCIVSRQYMQILGGAHRTRAFFAISGPHRGTLTAYLYFGQGAKDMRPGSELLRNLSQSENRLSEVRLFAYWTSRDITIFPASSCSWSATSHVLNVKAMLHQFMPSNRQMCADIVQQMSLLSDQQATTAAYL